MAKKVKVSKVVIDLDEDPESADWLHKGKVPGEKVSKVTIDLDEDPRNANWLHEERLRKEKEKKKK